MQADAVDVEALLGRELGADERVRAVTLLGLADGIVAAELRVPADELGTVTPSGPVRVVCARLVARAVILGAGVIRSETLGAHTVQHDTAGAGLELTDADRRLLAGVVVPVAPGVVADGAGAADYKIDGGSTADVSLRVELDELDYVDEGD